MNLSQTKKQKRLVKEGQIWKLGEHLLLAGDCTDSVLVGKLCKDTKIHAVITDPPYGIQYVESKENLSPVFLYSSFLLRLVSVMRKQFPIGAFFLDVADPH